MALRLFQQLRRGVLAPATAPAGLLQRLCAETPPLQPPHRQLPLTLWSLKTLRISKQDLNGAQANLDPNLHTF